MIEFHVKNHVEKIEVSADLESNKHENGKGTRTLHGQGTGQFSEITGHGHGGHMYMLKFSYKNITYMTFLKTFTILIIVKLKSHTFGIQFS